MTQRNDLAVIQQQASSSSLMPTASEWSLMRDMAEQLLPTGFLPGHIKKAEQAVAIMLKGRELNIPPMYALSNVVVVQGKPTCSAELMLALVQREHGINAMWVEDSTNDHCTVGYRSGNGKKFYTFTIEDAKKAGLAGKGVWSQYPAAMLRARAISATARMAFPGAIGGMYSPGELGDEVTVDEDGFVTSEVRGEIYGEPDKWGPGTGGGFREDAAQSTPAPRQRAQQSVQVTSIETPDADAPAAPERVEDDDDWQKASNYLHVVAGKHGITHDHLHNWAVSKGHDSLKGMSTTRLRSMANKVNLNPEDAKDFFAQFAPAAAEDEPIEAEFTEAGQQGFDPSLMPDESELPNPDRHTRI